MGLDPGYGRMGFGVIYVEGTKMSLVDYGVATTTSVKPGARPRLRAACLLSLIHRSISFPRGFAPRTPLHAPSLAALARATTLPG